MQLSNWWRTYELLHWLDQQFELHIRFEYNRVRFSHLFVFSVCFVRVEGSSSCRQYSYRSYVAEHLRSIFDLAYIFFIGCRLWDHTIGDFGRGNSKQVIVIHNNRRHEKNTISFFDKIMYTWNKLSKQLKKLEGRFFLTDLKSDRLNSNGI